MTIDLTIRPDCPKIAALPDRGAAGSLDGHDVGTWKRKTRCELGLAEDGPVIATGHQSLLWHPGILAKYLLLEALAGKFGFATANLIVDQHAGDYASFDVPIRRTDGSLAVRTLRLANVRKDEPMGRHEPFSPAPPPRHLPLALPHIQEGVDRIYEACKTHQDAPNAAVQMARALSDLMKPWVNPIPNVTATDLVETSLSRAIMRRMVEDPHQCAESYNRAVAAVPGAGIGPLLIRDDYVELPLWRLREDNRRMRAYDNDIEKVVECDADAPDVLPRALFMTALVRLAMCDLFIHGTGGANYDRAMEIWIKEWLGLTAAPIAVATATVRLDLRSAHEEHIDLEAATAAARRAWHNPEHAALEATGPGEEKRRMLEAIEQAPRRSPERRRAFFAMHDRLRALREQHREQVAGARDTADLARRQAQVRPIADRRDWAFPLYAEPMISDLAAAVAARVNPCTAGSDSGH